MTKKRNILVVYCYRNLPIRATTKEHLYSFRNYSNDNVYYLNLTFKEVPWYIHVVKFDLIVFHTLFLTHHWGGKEYFQQLLRKAKPLIKAAATKIMLPQDEFIHSQLFSEFINEFGIDCVFSVAPEKTWEAIYNGVDFRKVRFYQVLTGYLDENKVPKIAEYSADLDNRGIDIGYRTVAQPYFWFGRHGFLKQQIADVFIKAITNRNMQTDISTSAQDAIIGDSWYKFLLNCKYTIGVEGGTSIVDPDGSIKSTVEQYLLQYPEAEFQEVEAKCFPGKDGKTELFALSPRHLEACLTRTCQILVEGDYNGILQPNIHYIPLRKDLSNIEEVLDLIETDSLRREITDGAFADIVKSGRYTYRNFVKFVIEQALAGRERTDKTFISSLASNLVYYWMYLVGIFEWRVIQGLHMLPPGIKDWIRKIKSNFRSDKNRSG